MRERKRKHDDVHRPMGGTGKRAAKRYLPAPSICPNCGLCAPWHKDDCRPQDRKPRTPAPEEK